jgi:GNAT superfamily N-acetyltransferase
LGYSRKVTDELLGAYASELGWTRSHIDDIDRRIGQLATQLEQRERELAEREKELVELRSQLDEERERRAEEAKTSLALSQEQDALFRFLSEELRPVLAAAEESAARIMERAQQSGDRKLRRANLLLDRLRSQTERFQQWWERTDPMFERLRTKLDDLNEKVDEVPVRIQSALGPLSESVGTVKVDLREAVQIPAPPPPGIQLETHPLIPDRWKDFEELFGSEGAFGGCWCMQWRLPESVWVQQLGVPNHEAFRNIVMSGAVPGLLGYIDRRPVAWCSVGPRTAFPTLRTIEGLPDGEVDGSIWSVVCFFIADEFRSLGLMRPLLEAAIGFARERGATVLEGYPVEPRGELTPPLGFTGVVPVFRDLGFTEVAHPVPHQMVVRRSLTDGAT